MENATAAPAKREPSTATTLKRALRSIHAWIGIVSSINILILVSTGFAIQHREQFGLDDKYISRRFLPAGYRPMDDTGVRSDIVITDVHSGRILGKPGPLIVDGLSIAWVVLVGTGLLIYASRIWRRFGNGGGR